MQRLALILIVICSGCSAGGSTEADCLTKYAVKAKAPMAARAAAVACRELHNPEATPKQRRWAECILDRVPEAETDLGVRAAGAACNQIAGD